LGAGEFSIQAGICSLTINTKRKRIMPNSRNSNSGNFANDRTKASEAGRKGGKTTTTTVDKEPKTEMGRKPAQKSK
jgi:general stress protein YciG